MITIEKKQEIQKKLSKKQWHKPTILTITQIELTNHIKAAAWSQGGCLGVVSR